MKYETAILIIALYILIGCMVVRYCPAPEPIAIDTLIRWDQTPATRALDSLDSVIVERRKK